MIVVCCVLSMSHYVSTFIIDFSSFYNGLKQLCSLKLVSIFRARLWKVVMKCKIVMLFNFLDFFFKMFLLEVSKFYLTKYQVSNQFNFSEVVCICKIHIFNGVIPCQIIQNFWIMSPLSHGFFWNFHQW